MEGRESARLPDGCDPLHRRARPPRVREEARRRMPGLWPVARQRRLRVRPSGGPARQIALGRPVFGDRGIAACQFAVTRPRSSRPHAIAGSIATQRAVLPARDRPILRQQAAAGSGVARLRSRAQARRRQRRLPPLPAARAQFLRRGSGIRLVPGGKAQPEQKCRTDEQREHRQSH